MSLTNGSNRLVADLESDGLLPEATQIWQISTIDIDTGERRSYNRDTLEEGIAALLDASVLIMHNGIGFDLPLLAKVEGVKIDYRRCTDTLVLSKLAKPAVPGGHSLEAWAERLDKAPTKVVHEDWTQWSPEMEQRCNTDCEIGLAVWNKLKWMPETMPQAVATEYAVANAVALMVARGFTLDIDQAHTTLSNLMSERDTLLVDLREAFPPVFKPAKVKEYKNAPNRNNPMFGLVEPGSPFTPVTLTDFNPAARQDIAQRFITKYGWKPKVFTDGGQPEVSDKVLQSLQYPEAVLLSKFLWVEKQISQINSQPKSNGSGGGWLHHVSEDNRVHPNFDPTRANTHRSACSSPNLQQVSSEPEMRRCWVPKPRWVLLGVDAAGLELRCLAHYLAKHDSGAYAKILVEGDIHDHVQKLLQFNTRGYVKNVEYGWLYGAGDAKLGEIKRLDMAAVGETTKVSNTNLGKEIRADLTDGIDGLKAVVDEVQALAETGKLPGIDGRTLWVRSTHSALNLLLQSCGAILIKTAWALMERTLEENGFRYEEDWATVIQVHDEWQIECVNTEIAEGVGTIALECLEEAGEILKFRCPLDGSIKIGSSWAETH